MEEPWLVIWDEVSGDLICDLFMAWPLEDAVDARDMLVADKNALHPDRWAYDLLSAYELPMLSAYMESRTKTLVATSEPQFTPIIYRHS